MKEHTTQRKRRTRMTVPFATLRETVTKSNSEWAAAFERLTDFWPTLQSRLQLTDEELARLVQKEHLDRVESFLDELIFGTLEGSTLEKNSFLPTPREAFLLLAAAWFQIAGLIGVQADDEKLEQIVSALGAEFVREATIAGLASDDQELLAQLLEAQSTAVDPSELEGADDTHEGLDRPSESVNLQKLAALLRVANLCTLQSGLCPLSLRDRLKPVDVKGPRSAYLGVTALIERIEIDHGTASLVVHARFPAAVNLSHEATEDGIQCPLTLDVRPALEYLRTKVESIVHEVSPFLQKCASTRIKYVRLKRLESNGAMPLDRLIPQIWALQMAATTCATEGACCFGLVIDRLVGDELAGRGTNGTSIRERLENKCNAMLKLQPFNVLATRLARNILQRVKRWGEKQPTKKQLDLLKENVRQFFQDRQAACFQIGEVAVHKLAGIDVVVVYGMSRNVLRALEDSDFQGRLFVVPINSHLQPAETMPRRPESVWYEHDGIEGHDPLAGEDARLQAWCNERGIKLTFIAERMLPTIVSSLKRQKSRVVFLAGARSATIRKKGKKTDPLSCFSTVGNLSIAHAVRRGGGEVIVLVDRGKAATPTEEKALRGKFNEIADDPDVPPYLRVDELLVKTDVDLIILPS